MLSAFSAFARSTAAARSGPSLAGSLWVASIAVRDADHRRSITSEKSPYRKLSGFVISRNYKIELSPFHHIESSLMGFGGNQMGRKPKTTGPTARNNPEAFKQVLTRMGVDGWRTLRLLAVERDTTVNALAIEAFNDLLKKYGKRQSVENPLLE